MLLPGARAGRSVSPCPSPFRMVELVSKVLEYVARAKRAPSAAVDDAELAELLELARREIEDTRLAALPPVTRLTWMSRVLLDPAVDSAPPDRHALQETGIIVGFIPTVLGFDGDFTRLEDVDVSIELRNGNELLTHRFSANVGATESDRFVNLPMISLAEDEGNALFMFPVDKAKDPNISFTYRWANPSATERDDQDIEQTQVSVGLVWLPLE